MSSKKPLKVLSFGGCTVNNPLLNLAKRKLAGSIYRDVGFTRTPYALSPNAIDQLWRFCNADIEIPADIRKLIYVDSVHVPTGNSDLFCDVDCALVEISTPFDLMLDGYVLNHNRIMEVLIDRLPDEKAVLKTANRWKTAVLGQKDEVREKSAETLVSLITGDTSLDELARNLLQNARSHRVEFAELAHVFERLSQALPVPIGIVLHNFHYMPDGRAIVWPPELNKQLIQIADSQNIPVFDPAVLVQSHGVSVALAEDLRHWNADFYPTIADGFYQFMSDFLSSETPLQIAC